MAATATLVFEKIEILTICPLYGASLHQRGKFRQIGQTVAETRRFNGFFQNGGPSRRGILVVTVRVRRAIKAPLD